jgi:hypothetical protein
METVVIHGDHLLSKLSSQELEACIYTFAAALSQAITRGWQRLIGCQIPPQFMLRAQAIFY